MSDDVGLSRQIAPYGATAQPAIAARMAPQLRLTVIGAVCAALAVIAAVAAVVMFPSFAGAGPGLSWAVGALASAALMLAICVIQVVVWRRAMASWSGRRRTGSARREELVMDRAPGVLRGGLGGFVYLHGGECGSCLVVRLSRATGGRTTPCLRGSATRWGAVSADQRPAGHPPGTYPAHERAFAFPQRLNRTR